MKQQHETEPNMTELPEVYSTMPNKWEKWTPKSKNVQHMGMLPKKKPLLPVFTLIN